MYSRGNDTGRLLNISALSGGVCVCMWGGGGGGGGDVRKRLWGLNLNPVPAPYLGGPVTSFLGNFVQSQLV